MSRWIDADALIETIPNTHTDMFENCRNCRLLDEEEVKTLIDNAPSIDIVHCKECKHNYNTAINHGKMNPRCDFMDVKLKPDDFCSYGERRE